MDPRTDRVELDPQDQAHLVAVVELLRSAKAISVVLQLRRKMDASELRQLSALLGEPRGQSGRW